MNRTEGLLRHYDGVMNGDGAWHGDPIWQILDDITAAEAAARPLPQAHSIWEIVLHMKFWEGVATRRLGGQRAGLEDGENFPEITEASEANWEKAREDFRASNQKFKQALVKVKPERLDELSAAGKRSYYDEAHGLIEHNVYHAGQIALLKKALRTA